MFASPIIVHGFPAVLSVVATMPIGVVGFHFQGSNFASISETNLNATLSISALPTMNANVVGLLNTNVTSPTKGVSGNVPVLATGPVTAGFAVDNSPLQMATIAGMSVLSSATTPPGLFSPSQMESAATVSHSPQFETNGGWSNRD